MKYNVWNGFNFSIILTGTFTWVFLPADMFTDLLWMNYEKAAGVFGPGHQLYLHRCCFTFVFELTLVDAWPNRPWDIYNTATVDPSQQQRVNVRFGCQSFRIKDSWPLSSFLRQQLHSEEYMREEAEIKCICRVQPLWCSTALRHVLSHILDSHFYWTGGPLALLL